MSDTTLENTSGFPALRAITARDPLRWLAAGWSDFRAHPGISLFFGACFTVMGWLLAWSFVNQPGFLLALAGSFLLVGPSLALGLYDVSRKRERGETPTLAASVMAWRRDVASLGIYSVMLAVLEMLWSRSALVVIAVSFNTVPKMSSTFALLTDPANAGFLVAFFTVGAVFAALIFSTSVVSIPMLLDRASEDGKADAIVAGITSIRAVIANPPVMAFWAVIIAVVIFASMLPAFLGLAVAGPVIGHASWHAYRGIVAR